MAPTLLVLAAGMGSRYGGLKQIDPVGPSGETVLDYAVYLAELSRLDPDTPLVLEHLPEHEYPPAAEYVRDVARRNNLKFV